MKSITDYLKQIKSNAGNVIKKRFPKWQAAQRYKRSFGRKINWTNPIEMNEKIRWIQFNTDTSKWSILADKYKVRDYLINNGYEQMLVDLYGVWENAEDIDFQTLPNRFVIKTNHGCGSVYIVRDKNKENLDELRRNLAKDLKDQYGVESAEPHYLKIKPLVIAEELLIQDEDNPNVSLIDYKFYTVKGDVICCGTMFNRSIKNHTYNTRIYDQDWIQHDEWLSEKANPGKESFPKPTTFDEMKNFCRIMGEEFPFVRIDFYEVKGKCYFGEFTFTPAGLTGGSLNREICEIIGHKIPLH